MTGLSQEDIALAGEYVLGLLDKEARAEASARAANDTEFAAEIQAWQERLTPMLAGKEEVAPDHVWQNIVQKLPANDSLRASESKSGSWRNIGFISGGIAAAFAAIFFIQQPNLTGISQEDATDMSEVAAESADMAADVPAVSAERAMEAAAEAEPEAADAPVILTASVDGGNGANIVRARYNSGSKILLMDAVSLKTAPLYPEIWIVPADGKARSLGMIKTSGQTQLKINSEMQQYIYDGADIVITPEPQGGAPGGVATGPAIALGKLSKA